MLKASFLEIVSDLIPKIIKRASNFQFSSVRAHKPLSKRGSF